MQLIQYLPDPMRPESPPIDPYVQATIEEALDNGDALDITLQTLDGSKEYRELLPVRLLLQEEILYLLAEDPNAQTPEDSITMLPLHRMTEAKAKFSHNDSSFEPDLAQTVALGVEDTIKLVIRVNRPLAEALFNRPIGLQQKLIKDHNQADRFIVTTYIENSPQLRRWLSRRLGEELELVEPTSL